MEINKALITINTSANNRAAKLLDFFEVSVSPADEWIIIKYESIDQIPSICRLLEEANIEVLHISVAKGPG